MILIALLNGEGWRGMFAGMATWAKVLGWRIALILILLYVARRFGRALIVRGMNLVLRGDSSDAVRDLGLAKRRNTLTALFNGVLTAVVVVVALLMVFNELGLEIAPILASAGVVGLAVGFGAQSLVKDIITGAFVILENQFSIGDVVRIGDTAGLVEQINLRTTVLRGLDGTVSIIPNGEITRVHVLTKGWSRFVLDVGVAYGANLDQVYAVLGGVLERYAADHPDIVLEKPELLGVENLGDSSVVVRALIKTVPSKQWECARLVRKLVKEAFDEAGIEIPFPQRSVWMRQPAGAASAGERPAELGGST